jgi:hypothetical protein
MTEENELEEPWMAPLRLAVVESVWTADPGTFTEELVQAVAREVSPAIEKAYRFGRMAGASTAAKRLAQKNLEQARKLREIREYVEHSKDGAGRTRVLVLTILAGDS